MTWHAKLTHIYTIVSLSQVAALQQQFDEAVALQAAAEQMSSALQRLPQLLVEAEELRPAAEEVAALEKELKELRSLDNLRQSLRLDIATLQPKVGGW